MDGKEHIAAGKRNAANAEKKGGMTGDKSVLLLSDDFKAYRAAGDVV